MANSHTVQSSNNPNIVNGPLNLSVNAASATTPRSQPNSIPCDHSTNNLTALSAQPPPAPSLPPPNHLMQSPQPAPMPQLILASGQLVQGIQGAQLLIPTSQAPTTNGSPVGQQSLLNPTSLTHLLSTTNSAQQLLQSLPQMISNQHAPPQATPLLNSLAQPLLNQAAPHLSQTTPYVSQSNPMYAQAPPLLSQGTPPTSQTPPSRMSMGNGHYVDSKSCYQPQTLSRNCSSPGMNGGGRSSASDISVHTGLGAPNVQSVKRSPSSLSPDCNDSSTADLLIDSP
ncbi:hypothetical protein D910_07834, partial [Dendroctonus ponderosae]